MASAVPSHGLFTSVAGTMIDAETLDPGPGRALIRRLQAASVPIVPVTVMTLDEVDPITRDLELRQPMVIEAGGAIARWSGSRWEVEPCGLPAETLLDVVREIEKLSGADLLVVSALPESDAARLSGRTGEQLQRATRRCFSEPFVIENGELDQIVAAAGTLGFSVRRGRRFLHLCRTCDRGEAFTRLRDELGCDVVVALGSTPVDVDFMSRAEIAIIVPRADGRHDPELLAHLPDARLAPTPGPAGWSAAIEEVLPQFGHGRNVNAHFG